MNWLNKLDKKYRGPKIRNLIVYIVMLTGLVYVISILDQTGTFIQYLRFDSSLIMKGQVWRLFTYVFIPPSFSPFFLIFTLYFYYIIGISLENAWGTFKFDLYYIFSVVVTSIVLLITGIYAQSSPYYGVYVTPYYINLTMFLAFARLYPNFEIQLFFFIPAKVKYLAWISWGLFAYGIFLKPVEYKIMALVALGIYYVFFAEEIHNDIKYRKKVLNNRSQFNREKLVRRDVLHECHVCGITEKDDPKMEFRYCSKCEGSYEYCIDHLRDHEHVKQESGGQ